MSSAALIEMLKRIDYLNAKDLDPQSLDWAFEDQPTISFMQWLCSIGRENVLKKDEIDGYESLVRSKHAVLTGSHLEEALKVSSSFQDEDDDDECTQSDVDQLEQILEQVQERKAALMRESSQLNAKQMTLKTKLSKLEDSTSNDRKNYDETLDTCNIQSSKIDEALLKLAQSVRKISELYEEDGSVKRTDGNRNNRNFKAFLSREDLSLYHRAEERFSKDLTAFTKKRFFEGMAGMAGEQEPNQYNLLDVSNPDSFVVDPSENQAFFNDCQEFFLLQKIFPQSEINRLNALLKAKKAMVAVQEAKSILHLLRTDQFPATPVSIIHGQSKAEENIRRAQSEASHHTSVLSELVNQLGVLQGTEILTGDYDLKLKRQDYFTRNQDRVIEYLESQKARNELLFLLYDLELRFHERTNHLLCAAEQLLQQHLREWNQRMTCLDDSDLSSVKFERSAVDARDTSCNRLYQMMAPFPLSQHSDSNHLYLPLDKLKERAATLYTSYESSSAADHDSDESLQNNLPELESCVRKSEAVLYGGSSTVSGLPTLCPTDVQASMVSLQDQIASLRSHVDRAVTDIRNKKKMLKTNPVLSKERELFPLFHTKPEHLISVINGWEEKLKIEDIS